MPWQFRFSILIVAICLSCGSVEQTDYEDEHSQIQIKSPVVDVSEKPRPAPTYITVTDEIKPPEEFAPDSEGEPNWQDKRLSSPSESDSLVVKRETLFEVAEVFPDFNLHGPTDLVDPIDGTNNLYVSVQEGIIYKLARGQLGVRQDVFLDISHIVSTAHNEEGLLGFAFDPDYVNTRFLYVYYSASDPRRSTVSRFTVSRDYPLVVDVDSELVLLEVAQPYGNHNGGQIRFGPDGFLYIGLGDGGYRGDPDGHAQRLDSLLGSILRIDVSESQRSKPYTIPGDNPFVGITGARPEIWAYGFRNPWRFSFDEMTGSLWVADVGQELYEEANLVVKGGNYGWNIMEANSCYSGESQCGHSRFEKPVLSYTRNEGCSIIGGAVYRGNLKALFGMYIYSDYCTGTLWGFNSVSGENNGPQVISSTPKWVTSLGYDAEDNIYILTKASGIFKLVPSE